MKKILIALLLVLLFGQISPNIINADMGMPDPVFDEIVIINKDGANYEGYHCSGTIPYGTVLSIAYEDGDKFYLDYEGNFVEISIYDAKPMMEEYEPEDIYLNDISIKKSIIIMNNDVYLYKGPSFSFDKAIAEEIPEYTVLTYEASRATGVYNKWYYVNFKGIKGWTYSNIGENLDVYGYATGKAIVRKGTAVFNTYKDALSYSDIEETDKSIKINKTFEEEETVEMSMYVDGAHGVSRYIKGKDIEGWVSEYDLIFENHNNLEIFILSDSIEVYEDDECENLIGKYNLYGKTKPLLIGKLYKGALDDYDRSLANLYKVQYETGKFGYIVSDGYSAISTSILDDWSFISREHPLVYKKSLNIYDKPEFTDDHIIGEYPADKPIYYSHYLFDYQEYSENEYMSGWVYYEDAENKGWLPLLFPRYSPNSSTETIEGSEYLYNSSDIDYVKTVNLLTPEATHSSSSFIDITTIILIVGGVLFAIFVGASIYFFNKKN